MRSSVQNLAVAAVLAVSLIGCSQGDFPTSAPNPAVNPQALDNTAGTWRMIVLAAPATFNVPAPDAANSAAYLAELATIKAEQKANGAQPERVKKWAGGGILRWNEIARGLAARFALAPAPVGDVYPSPSAANPFADPQFPFANPPFTTRAYSNLSIAQFEALKVAWFFKFQFNRLSPARVDTGVTALVPIGDLPSYPSEDAVEATVASTILKLLFPVAADEIAAIAEDQKTFALLSGKATPTDLAAGEALGRAVAQIFVTRAANDNFKNAQGSAAAFQAIVNATIARGEIPWKSQEVPPRPPQLPFFGLTTPWMLTTAQIQANRPPAPPSTTSAQFAAELAEVKSSVENITRDQLATVYKWSDGIGTFAPSGHWNSIASDFVRGANFSEVRIARTFALLNAAEFDAIIACWDSKYAFMVPRPTQVDPSIKTHVGLPNFPAYTSGHSSFSAAAAAVLGRIFPAGIAFFNEQRDEAALSRLLGGIHYRSDIEQGKVNGAKIAQFTIDFANIDGADQ